MIDEQNNESEQMQQHVETRLRVRLYIYIALSVVVLSFVIFHIITDRVTTIRPLIGFIVGILIGFGFSRIFHLSWDRNAAKVIYRLDTFGILILLVYIVFELNRDRFIHYFVPGRSLVAVSLAVLAGIMIGRVLGIRGKIMQILKENL